MAISYVTTGTSPGRGGGYAETVTLNKPSGVQAGDFLIVALAFSHAAVTVTAPSGWTLRLNVDDGTTYDFRIYTKTATSSEPSSYTWSMSHFTWGVERILVYRGVNTSTPVIAQAIDDIGADTDNIYPTPTISPDQACFLVHFGTGLETTGGIRTWTANSGTERVDAGFQNSDGYYTSLAWYDSNGTVAAGNYSRTHTASSDYARGATGIMALLPEDDPISGTAPLTGPSPIIALQGAGSATEGSAPIVGPGPSVALSGSVLIPATGTAELEGPTPQTDLQGRLPVTGSLAAVGPSARFEAEVDTRVFGERVFNVGGEVRVLSIPGPLRGLIVPTETRTKVIAPDIANDHGDVDL